MGNRNRAPKNCHYGERNYFQSADYNERTQRMFESWILMLATNRFKWVGLPDTCDARVLEWSLHSNGQAAICKPSNSDSVPIWYSLPAVYSGRLNPYGEPTSWRCNGISGGTEFSSDWDNGAFVYYSNSRFGIWNAVQLFATRLTHLTRTEDINLFNQHTPFVIVTPDDMKNDAVNLFKQISGYEPGLIVNKSFENLQFQAISTEVPYIGLDLNLAQINMWNSVYRFLGIEHLAFEKGERMISEEVRGNTYPTNLALLDCLQARRKACDWLNDNFGMDVHVYFNSDVESYNFNFLEDVERMANAGLIEGADKPVDRDSDGQVDEDMQNKGKEV